MPLLPPGVSRWTVMAARVLVAGVPALIAVTVGMLILLIGLALGKERREYALKAASCATDVAKALIGLPQDTDQETTADAEKTDQPELPSSRRTWRQFWPGRARG